MGNFQLGKFLVSNSNSFPIGTDAFLLSLLAFQHSKLSGPTLDLCAGSGVIGLCTAQKFQNIELTALELDSSAFEECRKNYELIGRKNFVVQGSFESQKVFSAYSFQNILVNPPYYLASTAQHGNQATAKAIQTDQIHALFQSTFYWLKLNGELTLILPTEQLMIWKQAAVLAGFSLKEEFLISTYQNTNPYRSILKLTKQYCLTPSLHEKFVIWDKPNTFSKEYKLLTESLLWIK